jgi:hypothetical protein
MPAKPKSPSPTPSRRERRGEATGRALVAAWQASGLPQAAFARRRGVSAQRLSYWRLRLGTLGKRGKTSSDAGFVEIPPAAPAVSISRSLVIVEMGSGVRVQVQSGFDPLLLRAVVSALASPVPTC